MNLTTRQKAVAYIAKGMNPKETFEALTKEGSRISLRTVQALYKTRTLKSKVQASTVAKKARRAASPRGNGLVVGAGATRNGRYTRKQAADIVLFAINNMK